VHVDNHAVAINPLHPATIYTGNDGGIAVTHDGGASWKNLGTGLTISQIYRMSSSRQNPSIMLCGLQDNGTFYNNGTNWVESNAVPWDGMDNAIHPKNDHIQIASTQYGNFTISHDKGASFAPIPFPTGISGTGNWTTPVVFNPNNPDTIYFGFNAIFASYDEGTSAHQVSTATTLFSDGAISLAVAPSSVRVLYAADYGKIMQSTDGGVNWNNVTGDLPSGIAITAIAVDYSNPMMVYVTLSGYVDGNKVFKSTTGGTTWTNFSTGLPNVPADCIAVDSSAAGGVFVGTDMGVYYRDDTVSSWSLYNSGLPNVVVDDLDINYTNYKVRAATYGRGVWECKLKNNPPPSTGIASEPIPAQHIAIVPNPTTQSWTIAFKGQVPANYNVKVFDVLGNLVLTQHNKEDIDAARMAKGNYSIEVATDEGSDVVKAVRN